MQYIHNAFGYHPTSHFHFPIIIFVLPFKVGKTVHPFKAGPWNCVWMYVKQLFCLLACMTVKH